MKLAKLGSGPEIFHTIQGEGPSAGWPAVFIRAAHCNLHCVWCDTAHTWNFEGTPWRHAKDPVKYHQSEVIIEIEPAAAARQILDFGCQRVVITGGEPLLQQAEFLTMIEHIRAAQPACLLEVETNATLIPSPAFAAVIDQFNVSPKLANSGMAESLRWPTAALQFFAASPKAWFKFVVSNPADLAEIQLLCARHQLARERILLMPEGRTAAELDRSAPWLAEQCRDLGWRFCDRLHVRLWGGRRGV